MSATAETATSAAKLVPGTARPQGAVALVTGASRGIGAAVATALADDGWAVGVGFKADEDGARRTAAAIRDAGGSAHVVRGDVAEPDAAARLLDEVQQELGPVLCLVNNAGVRDDGLALQLTDEAWDRVLETNLTSAFRLTRAALRGMVRARYGRIVNVASIVGLRANAGQANYAAAKAGLVAMTQTVAHEVARRGVTVNAVAPGFIATDMTADLPAGGLADHIPAKRVGTPEDVAAAVRFLASDAAAYVTAATLPVDGGLSA
ncbi:3-oxoacyl-ACP reductase FabG [Conexibacter sp. SYSU D00693]|uniref:3-oxoacyl-ACP reductase FabG n=1 Tax=Conexibacter sp. SYSU D00693 TaxID=2812560 RepID=UPI00196A5409|nr:3-oxoacyl-ACP reductase FabG [Conexibacter sp. SYSU D00693]